MHPGLPDTCAEGSRISPLDDQGGKASVFIEKERRRAQPKLGGFSSKPAGLALFYRNFFTCQSLDNKALSRCWREQLPGEAERHWCQQKHWKLWSNLWRDEVKRGRPMAVAVKKCRGWVFTFIVCHKLTTKGKPPVSLSWSIYLKCWHVWQWYS